MSWLEYFRKEPEDTPAGKAKERLKVIVAHQRCDRDGPSYLPDLQRDLMAVLDKYVPIDDIVIALDHDEELAVLELNVPLPPKSLPQ